MTVTLENDPGFYIEVNGHNIYGYSRYIEFYRALVQNAEDGQVFVEIGSFLGQSAAAMAYFIKESGKRISFYAVDLFEISDFSDEPHAEIVRQHGGDFFAAFSNNIQQAGVADYVTAIKASSLEASQEFADRSISFLMIDASHAYSDVVDDIEAWFPKVKLGGIIAGDDYDWPEVASATSAVLNRVSLVDQRSTWAIRKQAVTTEQQRQLESS